MALDKLNIFNQASAMQAVTPTKAVGGQASGEVLGGSSNSNNPFGSKLFSGENVGVNTNIGIGDVTNIPAQAGKKAGIGRTLAFA